MNYLYLLFDFCEDSQVWEIARYIDIVVTVLFIVVPVVLLIVAITDLVKAVTSQKDDEIKKATSLLIKKVVAAAAIFVLPIIISLFALPCTYNLSLALTNKATS